MTKMLTPKQAADRSGCGRSSIMRALASKELKGIRDNSGRWQITPEAVDDWMTMRPADRLRPVTDTPGQDRTYYVDTPETLMRLAVAEARLTDVTADRDRLAALLDRALQPRPVHVGIWDRIFGTRS